MPMILRRISESVYAVLGGEKEPNAGFVVGRTGILVIDTTFTPYHATEMLRLIRSVSQKPIKYVFNTHYHSDHTFGNQVFSAKVVANRRCREIMATLVRTEWSRESVRKWLEENPEFKEKLADLNITPPDVVFDREYQIDLGNLKVDLKHLGGHTPGTSVAYVPSSKVLFAGDLMFKGRYPYIKDAHVQTWLAALGSLRQMDFDALVPGHGYLCKRDDLDNMVQYFENLLENCREFVGQGLALDEIVKRKEFIRYARRNVDLHEENIRQTHAELTEEEKVEE